MPRGQPQNLKPQSHKLTVEDQKKGGRRSVEVRRQKKTIKTLLTDFLESDCKDNPTFEDLVERLGFSGKESVKQLFTTVCLINSMKFGGIEQLQRLIEMLGENAEDSKEPETEEDALTKALKEEAERMNKKNG